MNLHTNRENLKKRLEALTLIIDKLRSENFKIDMTRGKPSKQQLEISEEILYNITNDTNLNVYDENENSFDVRNYGCIDGIKELKDIFADMLNVNAKQIIIGGNSSLSLMYDILCKAFIFGLKNSTTPWSKLDKIKFLCPVPGYDRHFAMCEQFGIEMVNIAMDENGPNIDEVKKYVENDETVKGMWCVPKYSNPTGIVYSDNVIKELSNLKPKARDFTIFYDNAYFVHSLFNNKDELLDIMSLTCENKNKNMVIGFLSTSKITYAGAGVSLIYSSSENIEYLKELMKYQTIGFDKINQLRHFLFLKNKQNIQNIMKKHSDILTPKFKAVISGIDKYKKDYIIANYTVPKGGYFISLNVMNNCAKRVVEICKSVGVLLTPAGATFPYKKNLFDNNIRLAPSFIDIEEVEKATYVMMLAIEIAQIERALQ